MTRISLGGPSGPTGATGAAGAVGLNRAVVDPAAASMVCVPGVALNIGGTSALTFDRDYVYPLWVDTEVTFDQVVLEVSSASGSPGSVGRAALYAATKSMQPSGALIEDFGTFATDSLGVKTIAPAATTRTLPAGRYVLVVNVSAANATFRAAVRSGLTGVRAALTANLFASQLYVARAHAAFGTATPWTTQTISTNNFDYVAFLRVTAVA